MYKVTAERKAYTKSTGAAYEKLFEKCVLQRGAKVERTSMKVDIEKHIDYYVNGYGVDVKGNRRLDYIFLELVNVKGINGWLRGEADYIAFHFKDLNHFKVFNRVDLLDFVVENVKGITNTSNDFMKYYNRGAWGQKDKIVRVHYDHIKHLDHFIINC